MIETYFTAPHILDRMRSGPMAPHLDLLAAELQAQEYSRKSIRRQLCNADSFGRWLSEQNLAVACITGEAVARYVGALHRSTRAGYAKGYRPHNARGLARLLEVLRASGVLPPTEAPPRPVDPLQEFTRYLERVRGVARTTRAGYLHEVRRFVMHVFGAADPDWTQIGPEHVASFITLRAAQLPVTCRRDPVREPGPSWCVPNSSSGAFSMGLQDGAGASRTERSLDHRAGCTITCWSTI